MKFSTPITEEELHDAYEAGMIAKKDLVSGGFYKGTCRNASVATWSTQDECFYYLRNKFGNTFAESINHPEDDNGYDLFTPLECVYKPE